jgi:tripartite ATP-independent transporter DctM subunit
MASARVGSPIAERLRHLVDLLPALIMFVVILGSIYTGLATPTEAAALAVAAAIVLAAVHRRRSIAMLHDAIRATLRTTSMVMLILVAAFLLNFVLGLVGLPQNLSGWVRDLDLSPIGTIWPLVAFYLVLGCFLEGVAMMVTTIGVVGPLVVSLGFDLVWFGIFMTIIMQLALIAPPVGLNLYVVRGLHVVRGIRGTSGSIRDVFVGVMPFVVAMLIIAAVLICVPELALWLPRLMFQ